MLPHGCLAAKKKKKKKTGDSKLEQRNTTDAMIPLVYLGFNIKELKTGELQGLNMINIISF